MTEVKSLFTLFDVFSVGIVITTTKFLSLFLLLFFFFFSLSLTD